MKPVRTHSAWVIDALVVLGRQIAVERRAHRWTQHDLAERAGISYQTLAKIEKGSPTPAIGTVFELASLLGIPLVGAREAHAREVIDTRFALMPSRVERQRVDEDDDF